MIYQVKFYFRKNGFESFTYLGGLWQYGIEKLSEKFKNKSIVEIIGLIFPEYVERPSLFKCEIAFDFHKAANEFIEHTGARISYTLLEDLKVKLGRLTLRQARVLKLMQEGASIGKISETLKISKSTVKGYQQKIFAVFGIHKSTELVIVLNSSGL